MKLFKRILSLALLATLSVSLMGCQTKASTKEAVIGTWEAEIDLADYVSDAVDNTTLQDMLALGDAKFTLVAEFDEDDTCRVYFKQDDFESWLANVRAYVTNALEKTYEDALTEQADDENVSLGDLLGYLGVDDAAEFIEKTVGGSLEDFVNDKLGDLFDGIEAAYNKLNIDGTYTTLPGKVIMTSDDHKQTATYDEETDTLTIKGYKTMEIVMHRQ